MKIEIYPNIISKVDIERLMTEVNPRETATDMTYFIEGDGKYGCKKVKCTTHDVAQKISNLFAYKTESVTIAYYPQGSYNAPHADNCIIDNGVVKQVKDWTHTGVVFLNDNFEAGNLVYPNQGCVFIPRVGTMIVAPAGEDYIHYVEKVTRGERFTLVFRFV